MTRAVLLADPDARPRIEGLELLEMIGAGAHSVVYRARQNETLVAVKIARDTEPNRRALVQRSFLVEAAALARIRHPSVVSVIGSGLDSEGRPYVVLEHIAGMTLAQKLAHERRLDEKTAVAIASRLASGLSAVHERKLIHRDIKPGNILLRESGEPTLIDFGLAGEHELDAKSRTPVGTFLYAAPEQTGRLKIAVDGRADLYSLGVVLYECLSGSPPFVADSVDEVVRLHATSAPPALAERAPHASPILCAIVHKLLAKDPDDRYQTARSLVADLERIEHLKANELGRVHNETRLASMGPFIGQSEVMSKLVARLARASRGSGSVLLVRAAHGLGKTRVLEELERRVAITGGLALVAMSAGREDAPLSVFRTLIHKLAHKLNKLPEADRAHFRLRAHQAAGEYAPFLAQAFVALRPILGEPDGAHQKAGQDVLYDALAEFFGKLGIHFGVCLLAIEDAEALDSASLKVLRRLAHRAHNEHLIVAASLPDGEMSLELATTLSEQIDVDITLSPLKDSTIAELATEMLGGRRLDQELLSHLCTRAHGNPGILVDYLDALTASGAMIVRNGGWSLDRAALAALVTRDGALDSLTTRLKALSDEEIAILSAASVLGAAFFPAQLSELLATEQEAVYQAVSAAERARLIETLEDGRYSFLDERLRSVLYERLESEQRRRLHRKAAALCASEQEAREGALLDTARHHFEGVCAESAEEALRSSLSAGTFALQGQAAKEAVLFLEQARTITEKFKLQETSHLYEKLGEATAQIGEVERAFALLDRAIVLSNDELDKARLHLRIAELRMHVSFDTTSMRDHLAHTWRCLGEEMPEDKPTGVFWFVFYALLATFIDLTGLFIGSAQNKARAKLMFSLLENTLKWAYLSNHFFILLAANFRLLYAGLLVGASRELVHGYSMHAATLANMGLPDRFSDHYLHKASRMAAALNDRPAQVRVEYWRCTTLAQRGKLVEHARLLDELLAKYGRWFEVSDLFFAYLDLTLSYQLRGYTEASATALRRCLEEISAKAGAEASETRACREMIAGSEALYARPGQAAELFAERLRDLKGPDVDSFMWFQAWMMQLGFRLDTQDYDRLDEAIDQADRAKRKPLTAGWQFSVYWVSKAYARLTQCFIASPAELPHRTAQLEAAIKDLRHPAKLEIYRQHRFTLQAGLSYLRGDHDGALELLARAELLAVRSDAPLGTYEMLRMRARVMRAMGRSGAEARDLSLAITIAERQGWPNRARTLRQELGIGQRGSQVSVGSSSSLSEGPAQLTQSGLMTNFDALQLRRDRDALLEVSLATAQVIDPSEQAVVALDKLLGLLGGERAFLFLTDASGALSTVAARTAKGESLSDKAEYPRSIVEQVRKVLAPIVVNGFEQAASLGSDTAIRLGLRSMIAAPLLLRERLMGVVYVDSSMSKGIFTEADIDILKAIATQIAVSQETARSAQREIERQALQKDLQLSAAVQGLLLPKTEELHHGNIEVIGSFEPATSVGGDFWYVDTLEDGRIRVLVGDVTGHGAGSAMVTAVMAGAYRALRENGGGRDMHGVISALDSVLRDVCLGAYLQPLSALELSPDGDEVTWFSAASPPLLVLRKNGEIETFTDKGVPLGSDTLQVARRTVTLARGERALLYTDGVSELELPKGGQFGLRRLARAFARTRDLPIAIARERLRSDIHQAAGASARADDVTFVIVGRSE